MMRRCGCPAQADEIVFGTAHECTGSPRCECGFPFGAKSCPIHGLTPSRDVVNIQAELDRLERPYERTLSDGDGDLG